MLHAKGIDAVLSDSGVIWLGKDALRILGLVQPSGRPLIDVLPPAEEEDVRAFEDALNAEDDALRAKVKALIAAARLALGHGSFPYSAQVAEMLARARELEELL